MQTRSSQDSIEKFISKIKLYWQIIFLVSLVLYGLSFYHHLDVNTSPRYLSYLNILNWASFFIALGLAITIFHYKRKYFSTRSFRLTLEDMSADDSELEPEQLQTRLLKSLEKKLKFVWILGGLLILDGVIYYWWSYDTWNMHIYFIVGLYSLAMNYPRKDLFLDIRYLAKEAVSEQQATNE